MPVTVSIRSTRGLKAKRRLAVGWLNSVWAKLKVLGGTVWADTCDTWKRVKIFALAILAVIVYFEWEKIKALWLVKSGQAELKSDNKQDAQLKAKEDSDNEQADALVKKAQNE